MLQLDSNSCQFPMEAFSVFRNYQFYRADIRHVLHDRISSCGRVSLPRCTLATWARSTWEKFIYLRFRRWPRARAIYPSGRSRAWLDLSETFFSSKQRISRSREATSGTWPRLSPRFSSFSTNRASLSRSISVFLSHVSSSFVARCSIGCLLFRSGKGVRMFFARMYDTREQHLVHGNRRNRNFNESKTSVLHEESRNGRLSRAFRYREVWKGCEETQVCPFREP